MPLPLCVSRASTAVVPVLLPAAVLIRLTTSCSDVAVDRFDVKRDVVAGHDLKLIELAGVDTSSSDVGGTPTPRLKSASSRRPGVRANAQLRGRRAAVLADREIGAAQPRTHVDASARRVDLGQQAQAGAVDQVQQVLDRFGAAHIERHALVAVGEM